MTLSDAMEASRLTLRTLGKEIGMSSTALYQLRTYGEYPTRRNVAEVQQEIADCLRKHGFRGEIQWPAPGVRPRYGGALRREAAAGVPQIRHFDHSLTEEDVVLMQMTQEILAHFGLRRNPFQSDVESDEDVFRTPDLERIERDVRNSIDSSGLFALVGPSGAGKTTLWDGVEGEYGRREDVILCKVHVTERENLCPNHLTRALIYGIEGPNAKIRPNGEDMGRQLVYGLLSEVQSQQRKVVLWIDDAHFSNKSVLRQLKTFSEQKIGRKRAISLVLIGLPELLLKLKMFPEIGNRTFVATMPPVNVQQYLEFKLGRAQSSISKIFTTDGFTAFAERFRTDPKKAPVGFPLDINATCIRAMAQLMRDGAAHGSGEKISARTIDNLPAVNPGRRVAVAK